MAKDHDLPAATEQPLPAGEEDTRIRVSQETASSLRRLKSVYGLSSHDTVVCHLVKSAELGMFDGKNDLKYYLSRLDSGGQKLIENNSRILALIVELERGLVHSVAQLCEILAGEIEQHKEAGHKQ